MVEIRRNLGEGNIGDSVHRPGPSDRFEESDQEPTRILLEIGAVIRVSENGRVFGQSFDGLGDRVVVLRRMEGKGHAVARREIPGPHASGQDHALRPYIALVCGDPRHTTALHQQSLDGHSLKGRHAELPGTREQGHGDVHRANHPILGKMNRPHDIPDFHPGPERMGLSRGKDFGLDSQMVGDRGGSPEFMKPLGGSGQGNCSRLTKARGLTRFRLEGRIKFEAVTAQAGQVLRGPQLTHEARSVPGGAAGIPITLE